MDDENTEQSEHAEQNERAERAEETGSSGSGGSGGSGSGGGGSGRKEKNHIYLRPADKRELRRVVSARGGYKSVPHLLRDYLFRSLLPRIEEGRYFPGRLLAETTGRHSAGGCARAKVPLGLESWDPVAAATCAVRRDLRRLEERRAWKGGAGALPFCRCGPAEVVRAAAREIGTWSRGGPSELFSREEAFRWLGPVPKLGSASGLAPGKMSGRAPGKTSGEVPKTSGEAPGEDSSEGSDAGTSTGAFSQKDPFGQRGPYSQSVSHSKRNPYSQEVPYSQGETYQVLAKLPGRDRGGKSVMMHIRKEAKDQLKRKAARLGQTGSDLARRATRLLVGWGKEAPAEALQYISEESGLYEDPQEGDSPGFQVYVAEETKRRVEQAKARLKRKFGPDAMANQQDILQAAARLAIEAEDEEMRPPLPGAQTSR